MPPALPAPSFGLSSWTAPDDADRAAWAARCAAADVLGRQAENAAALAWEAVMLGRPAGRRP